MENMGILEAKRADFDVLLTDIATYVTQKKFFLT